MPGPHIPSHPSATVLTGEDIRLTEALRKAKQATADAREFYDRYREYFDCYAFASGGVGNPYSREHTDRPQLTRAMPGAAAGQTMQLYTPEELDRAVRADGYEAVTPFATNKNAAEAASRNAAAAAHQRPGYQLVAAFLTNGRYEQDFHFMLRDAQGRWWQKWATAPISEVVTNGYAPHQFPAPTPDDYRFVGYYWRPQKGLDVAGGQHPAGAIPHADGFRQDAWFVLPRPYPQIGVAENFETVRPRRDAAGVTLTFTHASGKSSEIFLSHALLWDQPVEEIRVFGPQGPEVKLTVAADGSFHEQRLPMKTRPPIPSMEH